MFVKNQVTFVSGGDVNVLASLLSPRGDQFDKTNFLCGFTETLNLVNVSLLISKVLRASFVVRPIGTSLYSLLLNFMSTMTIGRSSILPT